MDFNKFSIFVVLLALLVLLFGCTTPVTCGDGVCQTGEEGTCFVDCGDYIQKSGVSVSVLDESGVVIPLQNNIFVEILKKEELVDCTNPYFTSICEMKLIKLTANPQEIKFPSVLVDSVDSIEVRVGANGYSTRDLTINFIKNELNEYQVVLKKLETITDITPDLPTNLKEGAECALSSQCFAGTNYTATCSADIYGVKRCNVNATSSIEANLGSCIVDDSGLKIKTQNGICINNQEKLECSGTEWSKPIFCNSGCRNGLCVDEYYNSATKTFSFKKGLLYGLTFPVQPSSNKISEIFSELPLGSMIYKWMDYNGKVFWSMSMKGGRTGTFNPDNNLFAGEGFILKSNQDINFSFKGDTINSTTNIINKKYTPIGIPTCASEYTFSRIVEEVSAIEPLCNTVSLQNVGNGYPEWWSSDPSIELKGKKVDLRVLPHESVWIMCDMENQENQNYTGKTFEWSPTCSSEVATCKTFGFEGGTVDCEKMEGDNCVEYSVINCYKNGNFKEVWSKEGWDNDLEGSANFDTYAPFYYKRNCSGLAENCVGAKIEFTTGDFNGQEFVIQGYGKDTAGNIFEIEGNSWIELDTNIAFGTYPGSNQKLPFKSIDWNYKLFGKNKALPLPVCGNGIVEGNEQCDGSAIYESCTELGFVAGSVGCNLDCTYNTNKCAPHLKDCNLPGKTCTITACEQLAEINNFKHRTDANAIGGRYILGNDIDCTGIDIPMIGEDKSFYTYARKFKGEFDGNNYTINGLKFYRQYTGNIAGVPAGVEIWWENIYTGLFKYIGAGGRVANLTLKDVNVTGAVKVGGLAGASEGTIERVKVNGSVKGTRQLGGIVGVSEGTYGTMIQFSSFNGTITGKDINGADTGSIIGYCVDGEITSPKVNASVFPREEAKYFGKNVGCKLQHVIRYDALIFNGANALLKLKLDGNIARTPYYDTNKLVTIHDASTDDVLVEFIHDFSKEDLDLTPVTLTILRNYQNKNILFVNNLRVQETKTMFLEKVRPVSKAVCVLNQEVEDINQLLRECTKLSCPGDKIIGDTNVSCLLDENKFTIFGLKYSGIVEEWECGDAWCDIDENSISCPSDCNEYCGNNICGTGETAANCVSDCGPICGNGVCEKTLGETCSSCRTDCGSCGGSNNNNWTTRPIVCTTNASCGEINFIGERYCSGAIVFQKASVPSCVNPGRTDSNCTRVEKDLNIMECSSTQTCTSGKCVENKVTYDSISCTTNIGCSGTQECSQGFCKDIVCEQGYYPKEHKCFCEGTHCTASLLEDDANKITDGNLLNEETAQFDWFSLLFWLFIILFIIIIIGLFIWFFIIKKKKKQEPTLSGPKYF